MSALLSQLEGRERRAECLRNEAKDAGKADAGYAIQTPVGGGAVMTTPNPWGDPHIEWMLRYSRDLNDPKAGRFTAAEIVASFDYLVSGAITMKEATRRLRLLRNARAAVLDRSPSHATRAFFAECEAEARDVMRNRSEK